MVMWHILRGIRLQWPAGYGPLAEARSRTMLKQDSMSKATSRIEKGLTNHAWKRMNARGLSSSTVGAALEFGRVAHVRGAVIYAIGRKEVEEYAEYGIDLKRQEGVQVVCKQNGAILTVYRNHDFRGLRPSRRNYRPAA
jgi:hypothetical protein